MFLHVFATCFKHRAQRPYEKECKVVYSNRLLSHRIWKAPSESRTKTALFPFHEYKRHSQICTDKPMYSERPSTGKKKHTDFDRPVAAPTIVPPKLLLCYKN